MKQKLSPQTSSFIVLACMCLFGGLLVIFISSQTLRNEVYEKNEPILSNLNDQSYNPIPTASASEELQMPDTSKWQDHRYTVYGISFKTPKNWKVTLPKKQGDFEVGEINPGPKFANVKIYISPKDYFLMAGLPANNTTVGGKPALNVSNMLYGVSANEYYFTFDLGTSVSLLAEFNAMVKSVEFGESIVGY